MKHVLLFVVIGALQASASETDGAPESLTAVGFEEDPGVRVHIDANVTGARLLRVAGTAYGVTSRGSQVQVTSIVDVCGVPCNQRVDGQSEYFIEGDAPPSDPFRIEGLGSDVTLKVNAGSKALFSLGRILNNIGAVALIVGVSTIPLVLLIATSLSGLLLPAIIVAAAGAIMLGVGIPLTIFNKTSVEVIATTPGAAPRGPGSVELSPTTSGVPVTVARF
jgi:hypothetical protein